MGAYSRRRTSLDVLKYVERAFGQDALVRTLRRLQVTPSLLEDPDALISLRFLTDLCDHLGERGFSDETLIEMGKFTTLVNADSVMGRLLSECPKPRELYDLQINHLMTHYDFNFSYRTTRLNHEGCLIEVRENQDVASELGVTHLGSPRNCLTRLGRAAAVTAFAGLAHSRIVETHCVHRGDACCILKVDYSDTTRSAAQLDS